MATTETDERREPRPHPLAGRIAHLLEAPLLAVPGAVAPVEQGLADALAWPPVRRVRSLFGRWHWIVAVLVYLAGALIMQRHAIEHPATIIAGNIQGDPTQYMWAMWWWPHAIFSGVNPFVTHAIWVPNAYNTGSITSTPTIALLFAPLNALLGWNDGPVVTYNLAMLLAPILTAWFTYRLCLYLTRQPAAAIAAGWLYGFGTYGLSQLQGHLQLVYTYIVPLLLLLAIQRLNGDISRRRLIVCSALGVIAEIGIGTEILFSGTVMLVLAWIAALLLAPAGLRRRVLSTGLELLGGYVVAAIITSPFLLYALTGPEVEENSNSVLKMGDLLGFIIPTQLIKAGSVRFSAVSALFTEAGGVVENGMYLGVFLIWGGVAFMVTGWRRWGTKVLVITTFVAFIWTLGSTLTIVGQSTIWLPWRLLEYQKPFNEITPVRIAAWVALGVVIAFAFWLARPGRWAWLRWVVAVIAAIMLWPNINGLYPGGVPIYQQGVASPAFITQGLYKKYLSHNEVVIPIPFGSYGNSLLWQAQARGYFRLASGWFGYIPPGYANTVAGQMLEAFRPYDEKLAIPAMRRFIAHTHAGAAVVIPTEAGGWDVVFKALGVRPISVGGVDVYRFPTSLRDGHSG